MVEVVECNLYALLKSARTCFVRAWWYQCQGLESRNQGELADGLMAHRHHGQRVLLADLMRTLAWLLLLAALVLLTAYCALEWT